MGHLILEQEGGGIGVAQKCGLLSPEFHDFKADGIVVVFVSVVASGRISSEHSFPQIAVFALGHHVGIFGYRHPKLFLESIVLRKEIVPEGD